MATQRLDRLQQLATFLYEPSLGFVQAVEKDLAIKLFIVFTWRSSKEQDALYQQGREFRRDEGIWAVSDRTKVVTDAPAGHSAHNVVTHVGQPASVALDAVPMLDDGVLLWHTPRGVWEQIWAVSSRFGFDPLGDAWGAYLKSDLGHFEEPGWKHKLAGLGLVRPVSELLR